MSRLTGKESSRALQRRSGQRRYAGGAGESPRSEVNPIYVRCGLAWEEEERRSLDCFLRKIRNPAIRRVVVLDFPMKDVYGQAWYSSGVGSRDTTRPTSAGKYPAGT